jgi:pSer/pThr/pTyr-binding forkhead associated (FHA) protein
LFQNKVFPYAHLDTLFNRVAAEVPDGYITAEGDDTGLYMFVIAGKPYSGAVEDSRGRRTTTIRDFFAAFKALGRAEVKLFRAEKKLLLCMLVRHAHKPTQTFQTDVVNLEDVIKKIEKQERDIILSVCSEAGCGHAIFVKGQAAYVSVPEEIEGGDEEPSLDSLLLYTLEAEQEKRSLTVELYTETKVVPAADSAEFPSEGIVEFFAKEEEGVIPVEAVTGEAEPEETLPVIELIEDGRVTATYELKLNLTIGRDADNDIHLNVPGISRQHALVRLADDKVIMEDLKSANGTFYKGIRIETKELAHGDEIKIRDFILRLDWPYAAREMKLEIDAPDLASQTVYAEGEEVLAQPQTLPAFIELDDGTSFQLGSITTIGSDEEVDIPVEGMLVSGRHAVVIRGRGVYKLVRKSTVGAVKVNGEKITEHVLKHEDEIEIGGQYLTFMMGEG